MFSFCSLITISILFAKLVCCSSTHSQTSFDLEAYAVKAKAYRLPWSIFPLTYNLVLIPDLENFKFNGTVTIEVDVSEETNVILLHSYKLDILSVKVSQNFEVIRSNYTLLPLTQMLNITTDKALPSGEKFCIKIQFRGVLNDDSVGFYRSSYVTKNGTRWLATTQFQPTFARMAFPCFDEPLFKAKFDISIARYEHQRILTNMPWEDTSYPIKSLNNRVMDNFRTTPSMPVHLVAFVVSEFYFDANNDETHWVWARQEAIHDCEEALSHATLRLSSFESYLNVYYDLPKMALAAIPDLNAKAMENAGLITIREPYILSNSKTMSSASIEIMTTTISNKFARHWFGYCVPIFWWDYLWLNEGLATFLQYFVTDVNNEYMRLPEKFLVEITHSALSVDGIYNHQQLNALVNTPDEIMELYDEINFYKAAAVFRMIQNIFREEIRFRNALTLYLKLKMEEGGPAIPEHIYDALEAARLYYNIPMPPGTNLFLLTEQFFHQVGYPLITVTRHTGTENIDIRIKQSPYSSPRSQKEIPDQIWTIPIACARKKMYDMEDANIALWSYNKEEILLENEVEENEWYICNVQQTGYFRVNYDKENWNLIIQELNTAPEEIHQMNRAQILDDSYTFALDEKLSFSMLLNILRYLKWERDEIPWYTGMKKLRDFYTRYELTHLAINIKNFIREIITDFYNINGFSIGMGDSHTTRAFRNTLTMMACEFNISDCVLQAKYLYDKNKTDLSSISGDIKETVLCVAIQTNSSIETWNHLWNFYRKSNIALEKDTVLLALGCATNEELHKKFLFKLIDERDADIRKHNRKLVFESVLRFHRGVTSALKFVKDMVLNLAKYKRASEIILSLLKSMKPVVKSHDHEQLLEECIQKAGKLNQKLYGNVMESLKLIKEAARENRKEYEKGVPKLSKAFIRYYKHHRRSSTKSSASSNRIHFQFILFIYMCIFKYFLIIL